jgi:LacI family transcriptional regulator
MRRQDPTRFRSTGGDSPQRRPTLRDVAERAGVHSATASRALNPQTRHLVNRGTADRVERVAKALGYTPNPVARSLKTAKSSSIGLILPDVTNPLFPPIVRGVEDVLGEVGYNAWIVNTDNDATRETAAIESMRARHVEGFVFATARLNHPLLEQLSNDGVAMVQVNRRVMDADIPSVTADDAAGVAMAIDHLVKLGHRRIAHLAGPQDLSTGVVRLRAYRQSLEDHQLDYDARRVAVCESWTEAAGYNAASNLLDSGADFTAVLAGNDLVALGCFDALAERRLSCPRDVSVVGFNDIPFMDKVHPSLTTVRIPHYDIGYDAARLLLEELAKRSKHARSVMLPPTLAIRESTRRLRPARDTTGRSRVVG